MEYRWFDEGPRMEIESVNSNKIEYFWIKDFKASGIMKVDGRLNDHNNNIMLTGEAIIRSGSYNKIYQKNKGWISADAVTGDATEKDWNEWNTHCWGR